MPAAQWPCHGCDHQEGREAVDGEAKHDGNALHVDVVRVHVPDSGREAEE